MCGFSAWLTVKDEPYHPSSQVDVVPLVVMLVSVVKLVSVLKLVFAVALFDVDEALDLELLRVVIGVESRVVAVVTLASGDAGVLGEAIPTPLSTLWKERCAGLESDVVRLRPGLT